MGGWKMRSVRLRITALLSAAVVSAGGLAFAGGARTGASPPRDGRVPGQVLVRFAPRTSDAARRALHARLGGTVLRRVAELNTDVVALTAGADGVGLYRGRRGVAFVEPNYRVRLAHVINDPCILSSCVAGALGNEWNLTWLNADYGWRAYPTKAYSAAERLALPASKIPRVAVLDTKIDTAHEEWVNAGGQGPSLQQGGQLDLNDLKDFDDPARRLGSAAYHGTYVAGILGAAAGNNLGIAGVGFLSQIMPVAVVDGTGLAEADKLASGIIHSWQRGARILNLSLGLDADSKTVHDAIRMVTQGANPALVVAAAGNHTGEAPFYPGSYPEVMSVSGTDATDRRAACSNYNSNVSVSAPADGVISLKIGGGLLRGGCGTSAAAPQVSGLAALLFSQNPARTPAQVRQIIERSADDRGPAGRDNFFGWGRINMERALRYGQVAPVTTNARATIPPASGGPSTITALATSTKPIVKAEIFLDREDCNGAAGIAMQAVDGAFGELTEQLVAAQNIGPVMAAGVHPVWIRTFDGTTWGPTTVGTLYVDRGRPVIDELDHGRVVVRAAPDEGPGSNVGTTFFGFTIRDDFSTSFAAQIRVITQDPTVKKKDPVFQEMKTGLPPGLNFFGWTPDETVPAGIYQVIIDVADEGFNSTSRIYQYPMLVL